MTSQAIGTVVITDGENSSGNRHMIFLAGGTDDPLFHVGGDFTWTSSIDVVDQDIDIDGGTFDIDGNFTLIQNAGADDFDVELDEDGVVTIGGDMSMSLNGGDDMSLALGNDGASTATWTVTGNCSLTHNLANGGSTFEHFIEQDTRFIIGGDPQPNNKLHSSTIIRSRRKKYCRSNSYRRC